MFDLLQIIHDTFNDPALFWNMLEAFGTIGATSVALLLAYYSISSEKRNRPKIKIIYDEKSTRINDDDWCQLGVNIENHGILTAKNIKIRIESIIQNGSNLIPEPSRYISFHPIDTLQNGEYQFRSLMNAYKVQDIVTFFTTMKLSAKRETFTYKLLITGDNISAIKKTYRFLNSTDHNKISLKEVT